MVVMCYLPRTSFGLTGNTVGEGGEDSSCCCASSSVPSVFFTATWDCVVDSVVVEMKENVLFVTSVLLSSSSICVLFSELIPKLISLAGNERRVNKKRKKKGIVVRDLELFSVDRSRG